MPIWERLAIAVASLLLSVGLIAVLSGFFANRDQAGVSGATGGALGQRFPDLGHAHLQPGQPPPSYNSDPPTSGAHLVTLMPPNVSRLNTDQLLQALELGNVVIFYGTPREPPELHVLAHSLGGDTPALAASGQAVIVAPRPGTQGLIAVAWTRQLRVSNASDPLLRQFIQQWLGHGAPGR